MGQRTQLLVIEKKPNLEIEKRVYHNQWGQGKRMYNGIMSILQSLSDGVSPDGKFDPMLKDVELKNIPSFTLLVPTSNFTALDKVNVDEISTVRDLFHSLEITNNDGGAVVEIQWLHGQMDTNYYKYSPNIVWNEETFKNIGCKILDVFTDNATYRGYIGIHHIEYCTDNNNIVIYLSDGYGRKKGDTITISFNLTEKEKQLKSIKIVNKKSGITITRTIDDPDSTNKIINVLYKMMDEYIPEYRVRVGFLLNGDHDDFDGPDCDFKQFVSPERFREAEGYCGSNPYFDNNFFNSFMDMCKFMEVEWLH